MDPALTDEPAVLAAAARAHLRADFLSARVAVSGANFAVAETGTLAVVESEGNGRMCLTLPQTLITVMGIEKVMPTWDDLEVFLQLLPRSSTGERMNPYTSMWTGVTPGDGPQQVHLVLLDNGRSAVLADEVGRQALHCIRCSACLNVCPVYERTGGHAYGSVYPGPIGAVLSPQLTGVEDNASLPYASSLCGACFDACPVKIDIPSMLVHLRARHVDERRAQPDAERRGRRDGRGRVDDGPSTAVRGRAAAPAGRSGRAGRVAPCPRRCPAGPPAGTCRPRRRRRSVSGGRSGAGHDRPRRWCWPGSATALAGAPPTPAPDRPDHRRQGELPAGHRELVDLLADRLADYRATVHRTAGAAIAEAVAGVLAAEGAATVVVPARAARRLADRAGSRWWSTTSCPPRRAGRVDARGHRGARSRSPRPAPSSSTPAADQGRRAITPGARPARLRGARRPGRGRRAGGRSPGSPRAAR